MRMLLLLLLLLMQSACAFQFEFLPGLKTECPEAVEASDFVEPKATLWWEHPVKKGVAETDEGLLCRQPRSRQFGLAAMGCSAIARDHWNLKDANRASWKDLHEDKKYWYFLMQKGVGK
tara:strand:- start:317 stop:673 length:357 start_codon:yes stop_codon:yes gene_type:complete